MFLQFHNVKLASFNITFTYITHKFTHAQTICLCNFHVCATISISLSKNYLNSVELSKPIEYEISSAYSHVHNYQHYLTIHLNKRARRANYRATSKDRQGIKYCIHMQWVMSRRTEPKWTRLAHEYSTRVNVNCERSGFQSAVGLFYGC